MLPRPVEVKPLEPYRIWLRYADGVEGAVDLSEFAGRGVFALWNDISKFNNVRLDSRGAVAWNDEVDLCPDALYLRLTGKTPEEMFPTLTGAMQHAGN